MRNLLKAATGCGTFRTGAPPSTSFFPPLGLGLVATIMTVVVLVGVCGIKGMRWVGEGRKQEAGLAREAKRRKRNRTRDGSINVGDSKLLERGKGGGKMYRGCVGVNHHNRYQIIIIHLTIAM